MISTNFTMTLQTDFLKINVRFSQTSNFSLSHLIPCLTCATYVSATVEANAVFF